MHLNEQWNEQIYIIEQKRYFRPFIHCGVIEALTPLYKLTIL